jgi:ribosomal protein S18 acetylase RimI-like enzyme
MTEEYAREISYWRYKGEYAVYNTPSYEEMIQKNSGLVNPDKKENYHCFINEDGKLIAYLNLLKRDNNTIFLGIGLAPEFCGKGIGKEILKEGIKIAEVKYRDCSIELQVRSWNKRAVKCYKSAGFVITKTETIKDHDGNDTEFTFMKYNS